MKFVILAQNPLTISWTLTDAAGSPVNDATVTATLFSGRSGQIPQTQPGTPVDGINALALPYIPASDGIYSAVVAAGIEEQAGGDYVMVIEATRAAELFGHWEIPAIVVERS